MAQNVSPTPATVSVGNWYKSSAAEATSSVASKAGQLHTLIVSNSNAAARFAYLFDNTAASGTVLAVIALPAAGSVQVVFEYPIPFSTGLTISESSSQATYTLGTADLRVLAGWTTNAKMS